MNKTILSFSQFLLFSMIIFSTLLYADDTQLKAVVIEELGWMDKNKMQQQEDQINNLAKTKLGLSIHKNWADIELLQQIIDRKLVTTNDSSTQEAMGVVLGNVMQADFPSHLQWKIYKDKLGRSKALCIKGTEECLFPVTMLSRRMRLELTIKVSEVYDNAIDQAASKLPKMPYGDELLHTLKR
jgi:Domain of unknown function (DUF3806)